MRVTLDHLRRYAVARSLFKPTTLGKAIGKLGILNASSQLLASLKHGEIVSKSLRR